MASHWLPQIFTSKFGVMAEYEQRKPEKTLLYKLIANNLETFVQSLAEQGKTLPDHVEKEFRSYLSCGIHAYGFIRLQCKECKKETLLPFSCKKRGFCPSCTAKKMAEVAAHLTSNILPRAPYRQFVLSVPIALRYWMATSKKLTTKIHKIFSEETEALYCDKATRKGLTPIRSGSVLVERLTSTSIFIFCKWVEFISKKEKNLSSKKWEF